MWDSQKPSEISEIRAFEFVIFFVSVVLPAQKHQSHYSYNINNKPDDMRSEEHTSELQSRETISYAVFCLKKKKNYEQNNL